MKNKQFFDILFNRKSVRSFTGDPINKEDIETLVKAGMAAPTAINAQPWAFIAVTQRDTLDYLNDNLPYAKMLRQASAAIIVCGDQNKALTGTDKNYWVQDCSAATENILLAAEGLGLGAVWTAAFPYQSRMKPIREKLELPENIIPLNVIPIGVPRGNEKPKEKWKPENLHWEKW